MNIEQAQEYARKLAAAYPNQHIGESTIEEMAKEFVVVDIDYADKVLEAVKGRSVWFPTPFEVREVLKSHQDGTSDLKGIRDREEELVSHIARMRQITYRESLALRRATVEDFYNEAIEYQLDGAGYYALRLRVLRDMEAR